MLKLSSISKSQFSTIHTKVAIVGAGTAGINLASQIANQYKLMPSLVRVFEPSKFHYYQPAFTMIGGGIAKPQIAQRRLDKVFPKHVALTNYAVTFINPNENYLEVEEGTKYTYDHLIIATGINANFSAVPGLEEALGDHNCPVTSIYSFKNAQKTWDQIKAFEGGKAIFTEPVAPIKCGGAPQKIIFLARDAWKGKNVDIEFFKPADVCFGVKKYSDALEQLHSSQGTIVNLKNNLVSVDGKSKVATFKELESGKEFKKDFQFLHVVPPHTPHKFLSEAGLTNEQGYVDVNKFTMQHNKFENVWSLGDASSLPTSKTAAAVMTQTPILLKNLIQALDGRKPTGAYNGYTSCPIFVGEKKLMLAEFKYDNVVEETFFTNQEKPRKSMFWLKSKFFPFAYWNLVTRGIWHGRDGINFPGYA